MPDIITSEDEIEMGRRFLQLGKRGFRILDPQRLEAEIVQQLRGKAPDLLIVLDDEDAGPCG